MDQIPKHSHRPFQFTLRMLFVAVTAICVYVAFPRFFTGVAALLLGVVIVGTLLTLLVFLPIQKLATHVSRDQESKSQPDPNRTTH